MWRSTASSPRLFQRKQVPWALKGGYALELRFKDARSTVDIDLTLQRIAVETSEAKVVNQVVRDMLQTAADVSLADWFEYRIGQAVMELEAAPYGGARYPVEVRMDDRIFSQFHLDAGIGDAVMLPLEALECRDWLGFAGIERSRVQMISREQQFAEKVHAYTVPRKTANSRVKDLVDMALLVGAGLDRERTRNALRITFERRGTHALPASLPEPPADWQRAFEPLAQECALSSDIVGVFASVQRFYQAVEAHDAPK